jgi:hypothetical protein
MGSMFHSSCHVSTFSPIFTISVGFVDPSQRAASIHVRVDFARFNNVFGERQHPGFFDWHPDNGFPAIENR